MNIDYKLLGGRVANLRKERRWTQEKLAERADLSNNYISNIENNYSIPSLETLMKICVALEVTPNDLLLGSSVQEANYLNDDIIEQLAKCTATEKRYVLGFIDMLLRERSRADPPDEIAG